MKLSYRATIERTDCWFIACTCGKLFLHECEDQSDSITCPSCLDTRKAHQLLPAEIVR